MPNESTNLKLKLYDPDVDSNVLVYDFLKDIAGYTSSNFVKIDTSINTLHDSIIGTDGNVVFYNKQEVFLAVHPVGSIFLSTDGTEPAELYGGTWEQIKDAFLLGAGDTYAAESTGGEEKHTLTESELPNVIGGVDFQSDGNSQGIVSGVYGVFSLGQISSDAFQPNNRVSEKGIARQFRMSFGSNLPHNNMPPYYSVYIWKRIE